MFPTLVSVTLLTLLSSPAACAGFSFSIQTPVFTQCAPANLTWDSTIGPYDILIANQTDPCGYSVADLGHVDTNFAMWNAALPAGWTVVVSIENGIGDDAWSKPIVVQPSSDTSCLVPPALAFLGSNFSSGTIPTSTSTRSSSSARASAGINGVPSTHQFPSYAVLLCTIASAASAFFAL